MKAKYFRGITLCFIFIVLLNGVTATISARGMDTLAGKVSTGITKYFEDNIDRAVHTGIIRFENFSGLSDMAAQKFYQMLVARLETSTGMKYSDLMINFQRHKGEFNLSRSEALNYLVYLKLIRNKNAIGVGVAIFSRSLDKLVSIQYFQEAVSAGEQDFLEIRDYGFKTTGFTKQIEIDAETQLLDFRTVKLPDNTDGYFFFYPEKIDGYKIDNGRFKKYSTFKLSWGRPYYPVLEKEGRLLFFSASGDNGLYMSVGGNFSPRSKICRYTGGKWQEVGGSNFVPFKLMRLNDRDYLAGAAYDEGKNYFKASLCLAPFVSGKMQEDELIRKQVPPFYALDYSTVDGKWLESIHLVDTGYNYRFFAGDFEERTTESTKRGAAIAVLDNSWVVVSDYSIVNDTLYFYKIEEGSRRLVYQSEIRGEVMFLSRGAWKETQGFWVYVKKTGRNNVEYTLQFWSETNGDGRTKSDENTNGHGEPG
ncbi:MAG: hypothetical protein GY765_36070 [bacterium]|nr:hypothetical protein [bacterium]